VREMGKPKNWNKLSDQEKKKIGLQLFSSMRGLFIISQALSKAIDSMKKVKPCPEISNIEDMEILHETLFPIYQKELMEMTPVQFKKIMKKRKKVKKHESQKRSR